MRESIAVRHRPTLLRIPEPDLLALRHLAERTRVPQSAYLREAIGDLLVKYRHVFEADEG
ncbi:MAG: ribbon-helix-helix domain-containing protein [Pseudomonadota bacterium]